MKIRAHAKKNGKYLLDDKGGYQQFFIWQVLRMKRDSISEFNELKFFSTHSFAEDKRPMSPVKLGFFKYIDKIIGGNGGTDGETISHEFAILALSKIKKMNVVVGDKIYKFNFTEIKIDDCRIRFENGNTYIPDLIGFFSKDDHFYKKWGGKVAIEVKVAHACDAQKIRDFEEHGIPIIEVTVSEKMQIERYHKGGEYTEEELENYFNLLMGWFENRVYARILSNPNSIDYQKDIHSEFTKKIKNINEQIIDREKTIDKLEDKLIAYQHEYLSLQSNHAKLKEKINEIEDELKNEKQLSSYKLLKKFWQSLTKKN